MKIAVVAANGRVAKKVIAEALSRGHEVAAFGRHAENDTPTKNYVQKDLFDLKREDLTGIDAVVDAVGAGSLFVNPEHTLTVAETPDFPDAFKGVAAAHQQALDFLRTAKDTLWTYISPAGDFQAEGERSGRYILAGEEFTLNSRNESIISYADYAIALVDEIEKGTHLQQRISVVRA